MDANSWALLVENHILEFTPQQKGREKINEDVHLRSVQDGEGGEKRGEEKRGEEGGECDEEEKRRRERERGEVGVKTEVKRRERSGRGKKKTI